MIVGRYTIAALMPERPSDRAAPVTFVGRQLGAFVIEEQIGKGGMGDVYRARDSRLRRDVAIKILPAEADDPGRRARFEREAQALAALSHPGIVTIHSIEESDGVHFIAMELVDGQTLTAMIPADGMPLPRLVELAVPLADAIGAAHGRGVIHRDLKPGNVMVTRDGRVKVLDFGLAKLTLPETTGSATTATGPLTAQGLVMGTCAYMSPEQAQGFEVDHRSDVFSFGVMLYELVTGRRPFGGGSNVALLAAIVKDTPSPLTDVRPDVPRDLSRIVRRCLQKDPARRYQSMIDVRNDLEEIKAELESAPPPGVEPPARSHRRLRWIVGAIGAAAVVLAVAATTYWSTPADVGTPPLRFNVLPPGTTTLGASGQPAFEIAVSPDGRTIAFSERNDGKDIWIRHLEDAESTRLPGTERGRFPFWSPDGRALAFFSGDTLKRIDIDGGQATPICNVGVSIEGGTQGRGGVWLDDRTIVFAENGVPGLQRVNAEGGQPAAFVPFIAGQGIDAYLFPFRVDGRRFIYFARAVDNSQSEIRMSSVDTPAVSTTIVKSTRSAAYMNGFLFFDHGGVVVVRRLDTASGGLTGTPVTIAQSPPDAQSVGHMAFAAAGTTLAWIAEAEATRQLTWIDRTGTIKGELGPPRFYGRDVSLSRDDKHVGAVVSSEAWIGDAQSGEGSRVARNYRIFPNSRAPKWSPDGLRVAFESTRGQGGFINIYSVAVSGSEQVDAVAETPFPLILVGWTEGNRIVWLQSRRQIGRGAIAAGPTWLNLRGVLMKTLNGGDPTSVIQYPDGAVAVSPDAKAIAYTREIAKRWELCLDTIPASQECEQKAWSGATDAFNLEWRADGTELVFRSAGAVWHVPLQRTGTGIRAGQAREIFKLPVRGTFGLAVSQDGQRFLTLAPTTPGLRTISGIANWSPPAR